MNKMKIILELSDIHVFFEFGSTPQMAFELDYSRSVVQKGNAPALETNFDMVRSRAAVFKPAIIVISQEQGRSRSSDLRGTTVIHCNASCQLNDFQFRFEKMLDRILHDRSRRLEQWYRWEERLRRFNARVEPTVLSFMYRAIERKARADPSFLSNVGGDLESAKKLFAANIAEGKNTRKRRRRRTEIKKTLMRESALAQNIVQCPSMLNAYLGWKPPIQEEIISENLVEEWLHKIRRGELEFQQSFTETYESQQLQLDAKLDTRMKRLAKRKEYQEIIPRVQQVVRKLRPIGGFLGALKLRRRVREAQRLREK